MKGLFDNDNSQFYLPADVILPVKENTNITLYHLSTHTSGIPRDPQSDGQLITYCGGNTNGFGSYIGFNDSLSTGVILRYNADFDDGANLILGPAIMRAIIKY